MGFIVDEDDLDKVFDLTNKALSTALYVLYEIFILIAVLAFAIFALSIIALVFFYFIKFTMYFTRFFFEDALGFILRGPLSFLRWFFVDFVGWNAIIGLQWARKKFKKVPKKKFVCTERNRSFDGNCSSCFEELKNGELCRVKLRCGHRFHLRCLGHWLVKEESCPTCRAADRPNFMV